MVCILSVLAILKKEDNNCHRKTNERTIDMLTMTRLGHMLWLHEMLFCFLLSDYIFEWST